MMVLKRAARRRGATALEAAVLLPVLVLLAVISLDFCRVFYYYTAVTNCARNGAVYAADNLAIDSSGNVVQLSGAGSPYTVAGGQASSVQAAALADWPSGLGSNPSPTVALATTTSGGITYANVTVSYTFSTVSGFAALPATVNLSRTVQVRLSQVYPTS